MFLHPFLEVFPTISEDFFGRFFFDFAIRIQ